LSFVEEILLKVALPLVIIGTGLYVAYELFLAEGNEEKQKKAWKSLTFGSIGVICIAMGYAIISLVSRLSI
jgi:Ni,Fe-hydrogenase I cytochrome b subunit